LSLLKKLKALNGLLCADVPLRNYWLTHSLYPAYHAAMDRSQTVRRRYFIFVIHRDIIVPSVRSTFSRSRTLRRAVERGVVAVSVGRGESHARRRLMSASSVNASVAGLLVDHHHPRRLSAVRYVLLWRA